MLQDLVYPPTLSDCHISTLSQPVPFTLNILLIQGFNFILYPIYNLCHCSTWTFQSSAFSGDHPKDFNQLHTICYIQDFIMDYIRNWLYELPLGIWGTSVGILQQTEIFPNKTYFVLEIIVVLSPIFCTCSWNELYRNWMVSLWELQPDGKFFEFLLFTRLYCCNNFGIVAEHSSRAVRRKALANTSLSCSSCKKDQTNCPLWSRHIRMVTSPTAHRHTQTPN